MIRSGPGSKWLESAIDIESKTPRVPQDDLDGWLGHKAQVPPHFDKPCVYRVGSSGHGNPGGTRESETQPEHRFARAREHARWMMRKGRWNHADS